jgi:drug/metabolite transporter (DMT)-like permease
MLTVSFSAILLSLGCGVGYAASDYFRKAVPAACPAPLVLFYFVGGQIPILAAGVWWSGEARISVGYWLPGLIDVALGIIANLFFILAVRRSPLSLMVPLLALVPLFTTATGALVLDETPSLGQVGGMVLIMAGLYVLYTPAGANLSLTATWRAFRHEPGVPLMLITALAWSLTPVFDKLCVAQSSVTMHGLIQVVVITALTGGWIIFKGGLRALAVPAGSAAPLTWAALSAGFAYGLQLAAYQATLVAVVEGLKRVMGLLAALVVGRIMFAEAITRPKVVGIAILAVGVPLILFG